MIYVLICLALTLTGITGLQFLYLAYLDRLDKDQKRRIKELENHCQHLSHQLILAEAALAEKPEEEEGVLLDERDEDDNEIWADVLEEA